jgi:hypothetical protein
MLVQGLQVVAKVDRDPRRLVGGVDAALQSLMAEREQAARPDVMPVGSERGGNE